MISRTNAALIIIDIQGNLAQAMHDKENLFTNNVRLIRGLIFRSFSPSKFRKNSGKQYRK